MDALSERAELSGRLAAGDLRSAGDWLVRRYASDVVAMCRAMVRERHLAEELAQDAFSSAFTALRGFRGDASPRTWLLAITRNRCIDHLRRQERDPWGGASDDEPDEHPDDAPLPADVITSRAEVDAALATLAEAERALVVLRFRHGLDYPELAHVFGLREGTVRMRLSRALARMRSALDVDQHLSPREGIAAERTRAAAIAPPRASAPLPGAAAPMAPPAARPAAAAPPPPPPAAAAPPPAGASFGGAPPRAAARASGWWARLLGWLGVRSAEPSEPVDDELSVELRERLAGMVRSLPSR